MARDPTAEGDEGDGPDGESEELEDEQDGGIQGGETRRVDLRG